MSSLACPLCQKETTVRLGQKVYHGLRIATVLCQSCGLVYHDPLVQDADRQKLGLSHRQLHTNENIDRRQERRVQRRVRQQIDFLAELIRSDWRTLEIGSGLGFLSHWLVQKGCQAVGVEPDRQQAHYARQHFGLEVVNCRFEETDFSGKFDFFAASHVIEHFPDPLSFLEKIRSLATPRALFFLDTPNIMAPKVGPTRLFSLAHNYYFSPQTLQACLARTGWQVEKTRVFRRDSFYVLARADQPRGATPSRAHAQEVGRAIRRHRLFYYLHLLFLLRKIPLWQRLWMYHYRDYRGPLPGVGDLSLAL